MPTSPASPDPIVDGTPIPPGDGTPIPPGDGAWIDLADPSLARLHRVDAVAWVGDHFVLAGVVTSEASGSGAGIAFWTSPDGTAWTMGSEPSAGAVVGFASDEDGSGAAVGHLEGVAAAWWTADGYRWIRVDDQPALGPRPGETQTQLSGIASAGRGFVAIGWSQPSPQHALIVVSPDGETWTRLPSQPMFSGVRLDDIAAVDGRYLLVGHDRNPFRARFWTSTDGTTWEEQSAPTGVEPTDSVVGTFQVAAGPGGWLLTVSGGGWEPGRAWWSADAVTWTETSEIPQVEGGGIRNWDQNAIATPTGFLVVTWTEICASGLWLTSTGRSWACVPGDPQPHPNWVVAASDRAIVAAIEASVRVTAVGR